MLPELEMCRVDTDVCSLTTAPSGDLSVNDLKFTSKSKFELSLWKTRVKLHSLFLSRKKSLSGLRFMFRSQSRGKAMLKHCFLADLTPEVIKKKTYSRLSIQRLYSTNLICSCIRRIHWSPVCTSNIVKVHPCLWTKPCVVVNAQEGSALRFHVLKYTFMNMINLWSNSTSKHFIIFETDITMKINVLEPKIKKPHQTNSKQIQFCSTENRHVLGFRQRYYPCYKKCVIADVVHDYQFLKSAGLYPPTIH